MQLISIVCDNCGNVIPDPTTRLIVDIGQVGCNNSKVDICVTCTSLLTAALGKLPMPKAWASAKPTV